MKNKSTQKEWLDKEINKDIIELNKEKLNLITEIKKLKKEDILPQPPKKLTIWQRIKKVLMG
jgi:hypothetical protein